MSLNSLGTALWGLGDYDGSRAVHEASLATARAFGDRRLESDNLDNLGGVAWVLADYERAIELYRAALAIRRDARDPRGIAISLINLGDTYTLTGDLETAVAAFDEALEVDRAVGIRRNEATALQGKGKALLEAGRATEARASLDAATTIHVELGDRDNLADVRAALALACLESGGQEAARAVISDALASIGAADRPALREWVRFAAWRVATAVDDGDAAATHLAHAVAAMDELVGSLPDEAQGRVLDRVPLHQRVRAARTAGRRHVRVALPRTDIPMGRSVAADEYVTVEWTIHDPADALTEDGPQRRRRICARLIAEAATQGATATDEDLARALGVSRRTILRDAQALAGSGDVLATRRRARPPTERTPAD
jgi:tetratricopeptide (TPR) repeat protein